MGRRTAAAALAVGAVVVGAVVATLPSMAVLGPVPPVAAGAPTFVEEAVPAGIDHAYDGDWPYVVGGGVAAFDCDDDGRPELYLAGGEAPAALYRNQSPIGGPLRFAALASRVTDLAEVTGAYPVDVDGDGRIDLAVLRYGENVLLRGLGQCRFERANEDWRFAGGTAWTAAFSATWEAAASWPTFAIGNYVDEQRPASDRLCYDNELVRPAAGGTGFGDPIALTPGWCALAMLFSDWDHSGRRDLRVSNDRHYFGVHYREGEEQLWRIAPGEPPRLYGRDDGWQKLQIWGMGIASHDLTGDGRPEVFLTSMGDNKLQTLVEEAAGPEYRDIALHSGATAHRPFTGGDALPSTAWHAEFADVNNDSFMDLFVAKGNVEAMPDHALRDPSNLLLGQPDGTFVEAADVADVLNFARARGAAVVDLDLDGRLDIVVVNRRENIRLWRNAGAGADPASTGHWLAARLRQPGPNRDAVGAWLEVRAGDRTIRRELTIGGGHAGGQLGWLHVGLGRADRVEMRVQWPDGETGPWLHAAADRFVIIERGANEPLPWQPSTD